MTEEKQATLALSESWSAVRCPTSQPLSRVRMCPSASAAVIVFLYTVVIVWTAWNDRSVSSFLK